MATETTVSRKEKTMVMASVLLPSLDQDGTLNLRGDSPVVGNETMRMTQ
jgi:hypothetical protein